MTDLTQFLADTEAGAAALGGTYVATSADYYTTATVTLPEKPVLQAIAPTGDETGNVRYYSTFAEFAALLADPGSNMTIEPAPGLRGGLRKSTYTGDVILKGSNKTIRGTLETFINHRQGLRSGPCDNIVIEGLALGVGTSDATSTAKKDIDNWEFGTKGQTTNVALKKGISWGSNDESMRAKWNVDGLLFQNWIFVYPFYPANHTKSVLHPHGPAASDGAHKVWFDKCIFVGDTRLAQLAQDTSGIVQTNCLSIGWHEHQAAIRFVGSRDDLASAQPVEAIAEGNLLMPPTDYYTYRTGAIELEKIQGAISHCYAAQSGRYPNQFIRHNRFTPDPVTLANGGIGLTYCSGPDALQTEPPFLYHGVDRRPTETEAEIAALYNHILDNAGNGSLLCQDVIAKIRAGTIERWVSPALMETMYGAPNAQGVPWVSGGTMGHGVV